MAELPEPERSISSDAGEDHAPVEIDTETVSIARIYDFALGGKDNFAVDRAAAEEMMAVVPETMLLAKANRHFLRQAVRYLGGEAGIRQISDIGSGRPTAGNVHEIAQEIAPETRVVYVDNDPIVLAHGRALLATNDRTAFLRADLREPDVIFSHPETERLIDRSEPFAVLLGGVLMHLEDEEDPEGVAADIRDRLPSGGYLLVSNTCDDGEPRAKALNRVFAEQGLGSRCFRTWDEQIRYFDGLELVEPGLVPHNQWRPGPDLPEPDNPVHSMHIGGVGRKP